MFEYYIATEETSRVGKPAAINPRDPFPIFWKPSRHGGYLAVVGAGRLS